MYGKSVSASDTRREWRGFPEPPMYHTYEIESELGSGGCGAVYKAWHKRLHKHMVLKELKDSSQKAIEVRRNEIEALKNIKNMYIPQVFDFLTDANSSYTVMEYIEGESLDKLLAEGRLFSPAQIIKWYYQLATALEELHKNGVCHRDIKPGNIILMPNGSVCLIDYNSALVSGNNTRVVNRSLGYASPEQHQYFQMCEEAYRERKNKSSTNVKYPRKPTLMPVATPSDNQPAKSGITEIDWKLSDIYSLGATMYHLLTGIRPPSRADGLVQASVVGEKTAGISTIIERSMRTNPAERFTSAHDLRRALLQTKV